MTRTVDAAPAGYPAPVPAGVAPAPGSVAARRRTSRKSLLAGVLVVLLGGLLALVAGRMLSEHTEVLAVARDVPLGATLTAEDLTVANVTADPSLSPISAGQESQIVGMVTQVRLVRGELLTRGQLGTGDGFGPGQVLVALPLKDGQFPARGLTPGQRVLIVATPGGAGGVAPFGAGTSQGSGRQIGATVAEVGLPNPATQVTVVDVRVGAEDGAAVAGLASTGNLAVVLLPAGR